MCLKSDRGLGSGKVEIKVKQGMDKVSNVVVMARQWLGQGQVRE